ncbi:MAG: DNA-binding response regulator [Deltaproteobacteria bacterium]|nr:DNA-binding response regulator [Deltaproteobacteria bacterium]
MKFLLVEDDPSHTILMSAQLNGFGAEILCTNTVSGAMQMIGTQSPFDLVVLDQDLPDGMGFDVQQRLREDSPPPPVIFVTADDTAEHAVRAMKQGARGYVIKRPNYLIELNSEVSRILSTHETVVAKNRSEYEERERTRLTEALERNQWNVSATARDLGMGRGKLRGKLAMLGIDA